ncbi:MAG: hypothetical protein LBL23_01065, partial [Coriobacteriales bacterium]|nr:hypothetical protein [Coriobacteriales bacterium]
MATSPQGPSPEPIQVTSFEASDERDATGEITINDPNPSDNSYLYTIYWSEQPFNSGNEAGVQSEVVCALGTGSYTLSLGEANKRYYVRASVLGTDGQTSALGTAFQLDTIWADRDHDGIPDWYCDKYLLWGPDEEKDIAASDENGNGISNLDEYLRGTDPTYVSETY